MFSWVKAGLGLLAALGSLAAAAQPASYPGIGRAATPQEVQAWDIDVRPDFKGLPKGSGSVVKGQEVWEGKCASCHGVFGEANNVFAPLVGGTTADDIKTGRVATLRRSDYPGRTTMMKLSEVSTLWDYINRAMPWNEPKSLSVEEVYAVTAYMLHLGGVVPTDFTLSDANIPDVQRKLPNRNGMSTQHGLWPGQEFGAKGGPDVRAKPCMSNCAGEPKVVSSMPDFARDSHGNLSEQNRLVGPQRGANTARQQTPAAAQAQATEKPAATAVGHDTGAVMVKAKALAQANNCTACHAADRKRVGPSWADIAGKHRGEAKYLSEKILSGGSGVWGSIPMPAQNLSAGDAQLIGNWLASGAP
jgi:S-disulfanyl-L-cysteine oxidoreductase SoxD